MQNQNELCGYEQEQHLIGSLSSRGPQDAAFNQSIALPATASAAVYTPSINIIQADSMVEHFWLKPYVPTIGTQLGSAYTLTIELQHSSDNSTFVRIPELSDLTITGDAGTPFEDNILLPPGTLQYVRAAFTTGATIVSTLAGYTGAISLRF